MARINPGRGADQVLSGLQGLGFSDYEARVYVGLLKSAPSTAYELSKQTGVPRANVYSALENLTTKGAVQPVGERPARYAPVPPKDLLKSIAENTSLLCTELGEVLSQSSSGNELQFVWRVAGEQKVHSKISELIERASKHVWIKASDDLLMRHHDELAAASRRGLQIIVILFGSNPERFNFGKKAKVYLHEGNGIRIGQADNLFTLTIDYDEALTASMVGEYIGAYTQSKPVVTMAETIIRHDIYMTEIFEKLGPQITELFGPHLVGLRSRLFSEPQLQALYENFERLGLSVGANESGPPAARRRPRIG